MIQNFSPKEIEHLLSLMDEKTIFSQRIKSYVQCKKRFLMALGLIDRDSMNAVQTAKYDLLIRNLK